MYTSHPEQGRLMEHFMYDDAMAKSFSKLRILVLDEADRLLDPGFESELRIIMHNLPVAGYTLETTP